MKAKVIVAAVAVQAIWSTTAWAGLGELVQTFLPPSNAGGNNWLGVSVAPFGSNALIGTDGRSVYVYDPLTGDVVKTISNPGNVEGFGSSVAAVGNNILVGAHSSNFGGLEDSGSAYLFNGATGSLMRTFKSPLPTTYAHFGCSVAALGSNALVGAYWDDSAAVNGGAVHQFNGSTGALMRTFLSPNPAAADGFGYSVAAMGNNVLIGSPYDHRGVPGGQSPGAAYLFDGSTGVLLQTFLNPTPASNDYFGRAVAAMGNNVLIGAPYDDAGASNSGAVHVFDGSTGALIRTILNPTPAASDKFGCSVAAVGDDILVGASGALTDNGYYGMAYLFDGDSGDLLWSSQIDSWSFGYSVAALGDKMLIGAPRTLDPFYYNQNGAAYLIDTPEPATLSLLSLGGLAVVRRRRR